MNKIATLAKIANRLDSLGLTREADILDGLIRKLAEEGVVHEGQKYIDAYGSRLSSMDVRGLILELKNELGYYNGTTDNGMFSTGITKIECIMYYLNFKGEWGETGTFQRLLSEGFDPGEFTSLAHVLDNEDRGLSEKCKLAAEAGYADWKYSQHSPPAPAPEATNKPVATGWDTYVSQTSGGSEVKKAWVAFASIFGQPHTPNFYSFVSWYNGQKKSKWSGKDKSPRDVVTILNNLSNSHTNPAGAGGGFTGEAEGMGVKR